MTLFDLSYLIGLIIVIILAWLSKLFTGGSVYV